MREQYQHRRLGMLDEDMAAWLDAAGLVPSSSLSLPPRTSNGLTVRVWLATKL
jgi:ArsR family transcriptional regulator